MSWVGRFLGRLILLATTLWLLTFLALSLFTKPPVIETAYESVPEADAIICLGSGLRRDAEGGLTADFHGQARAETCADLFLSGKAPMIIFTGEAHPELSSAAAMAQIARAGGVPGSAIRLEEEARSTLQNAGYALPLLPENAERILLVSSAFHLPRARILFHLLGAPETIPVAARVTSEPNQSRPRWQWLIRETNAIWFNVLRLCLYYGAAALGIEDHTRLSWFN